MKGTLMDKATGEPIKTEDGKEITAEQKFTPTERDGSVEITFTVPANLLVSKSVVAFEKCYQEDKEIAVHTDINDDDQTVNYPGIGTKAQDIQSQSHYGLNSSGKIVDTVMYKNLEPGKEYTMRGTLMDKTTGEAVKDGDKEIVVEKKFIPTSKDGSVEIELDFTPGLLEGKAAVVFEECFLNKKSTDTSDNKPETSTEKLIAEHKDINDEDQTVYYPHIGTNAQDIQSKGHYGTNASGQIVDTVTYKNLEPGKKYIMKGTLMDKETGKPVTDNGKEIVVEKTFSPEAADGSVEITLDFTPGLLNGKAAVVFEECYLKENPDNPVAEHKDINDENQTVTYPEIETTLLDEKTNEHISAVGDVITVIDTVAYKNLEVGREYTMTGTLMDKKSGKAIKSDGKEVTATQKFKPESAEGTVALKFELNAADLKGHTVVAFEAASTAFTEKTDNPDKNTPSGETVVATHEDINDEAQSVHVPVISTKATDKATDSHKGKATKTVTINDEVTYKNLIPGRKYTMIGTLMDKSTGKEVKSKNGKAYTVTKEFTAKEANGKVTLSFKVPGSVVSGKSVVVFETCQYNKIDVAVHHDIKDKNQTVTYKKAAAKKKSSKGSSNGSSSGGSSNGTSSVSKVKTGDNMNMFILFAVGLAFLGAVAGKFVYDKRRKRA